MHKVILLTGRCNQKCLFCSRLLDMPDRSVGEVRREIDEIAEQSTPAITFSGGEPSLHKGLFELSSYAAESGNFETISLQTNAMAFRKKGMAGRMKDNGFTDVLVALHAHTAALSDFLTQTRGAWAQTIEGIHAIDAAGVPVSLNIVVNAFNFRRLPDYIEFVSERLPFVKAVTISVANPDGRARANPWIVPRYSEIAPLLVEAHTVCRDRGITSFNPDCGVPACFMGGVEFACSEFIRGTEGQLSKSDHNIIIETSGAHKTKSSVCSECIHDPICYGVWKAYADIYGVGELTPVKNDVASVPGTPQGEPPLGRPAHDARPTGQTVSVRISGTCNNGCVFCPEAGEMDGSFVARTEVEKEISEGRVNGADFLNLVGGEPAIHPDFFHFIRYAKSIGYKQVSVVTNGRMFSYRTFCREAADAGLDRASVSLHSHISHIHDGVTRVKNSFSQSVRGISNILNILGPQNIILKAKICDANAQTLHLSIPEFKKMGIDKIELW